MSSIDRRTTRRAARTTRRALPRRTIAAVLISERIARFDRRHPLAVLGMLITSGLLAFFACMRTASDSLAVRNVFVGLMVIAGFVLVMIVVGIFSGVTVPDKVATAERDRDLMD